MKFTRSTQMPLLAALLFGMVFALFSPSLRYSLVDMDDLSYISNNPLVMEGFAGGHIRSVFSSFQQGMYSPLLWISYGLDAAILNASPGTPWGFHFTNVLLHALNSALLFLLLEGFCRRPWRALFFAALWAMHPLRVESVAWVSERKDVLSGFWGLLCIWAYVQAWNRRKDTARESRLSPVLTITSLVFFALGLLVKPSLVPIPFALLLLDFWPLRRIELSISSIRRSAPRLLAEKIPFFLFAVLASMAATTAHKVIHGLSEVPLSTRIFNIPVHYAFYLMKTAFPVNLSPLYTDIPPSLFLFILSCIVLLALTAWTWVDRSRHPNRLVGWLFFLGIFAPAIGLVRFGAQSIADRFTYLPAIGLSVGLLFLWPSRAKKAAADRIFRLLTAIGVLAILAGSTLGLLPAWRSPLSLSGHILSNFPDNQTGLEMHAFQMIYRHGNFQEANSAFDRIIAGNAYNHNVLAGKARCLAHLHGPAEAIDFLLRMPETGNPYDLRTWDIARYALMQRKYSDAIEHARRALQVRPADLSHPAYLHLLIMAAAHEKGDMALALTHARQFPAYAHKTSLALTDLLPYYLHQWIEGYRSDAYAFFQRLIEQHPDDTGLLNNIAWGLATADWSPAAPAEVLDIARRVCEAFPQPNPGALDTLAAAQANAGDFPSAIQTVQKAIELLPSRDDAHIAEFRKRLLSRLSLYRQQKPYREEAFSRLMAAQFGKGLPVTNKKDAP